MRLAHPLLSSPIHWNENEIPVLVVEHPKLFRQMLFSLSAQAEGEEGEFSLSLAYEPLDCREHLHVLRDYFSLPLDDRKLQNRFQSLLQAVVREELPEESDALQQKIVRYLEHITLAIDYPLSFSDGEYILPLLKALKCQPVLDGKEPLERLIQYLTLYNGLMKNPCFVLAEAHNYFSKEELLEFYRMVNYQKWKVLLIEQRMPNPLPGEIFCLLDEGLCELRLDSEVEIR